MNAYDLVCPLKDKHGFVHFVVTEDPASFNVAVCGQSLDDLNYAFRPDDEPVLLDNMCADCLNIFGQHAAKGWS